MNNKPNWVLERDLPQICKALWGKSGCEMLTSEATGALKEVLRVPPTMYAAGIKDKIALATYYTESCLRANCLKKGNGLLAYWLGVFFLSQNGYKIMASNREIVEQAETGGSGAEDIYEWFSENAVRVETGAARAIERFWIGVRMPEMSVAVEEEVKRVENERKQAAREKEMEETQNAAHRLQIMLLQQQAEEEIRKRERQMEIKKEKLLAEKLVRVAAMEESQIRIRQYIGQATIEGMCVLELDKVMARANEMWYELGAIEKVIEKRPEEKKTVKEMHKEAQREEKVVKELEVSNVCAAVGTCDW
jgi:prophage maintenance system killer protein